MTKYALVTGACVNTGVAIVEKFAYEGWNVVFTGRSPEKVQEAEKIYKEKFPNVDIVGYAIDSLLNETTVDEESVIKLFETLDQKGIFVETVFNGCKAVVPFMKENGGGNIIFLNSNTAYRAIPNRIAYTASKGGQLGLMRALAFDLGKYNIRVNAVLPGMIKTERWVTNPDFYKTVPSRYTPIGDVAVGEDLWLTAAIQFNFIL